MRQKGRTAERTLARLADRQHGVVTRDTAPRSRDNAGRDRPPPPQGRPLARAPRCLPRRSPSAERRGALPRRSARLRRGRGTERAGGCAPLRLAQGPTAAARGDDANRALSSRESLPIGRAVSTSTPLRGAGFRSPRSPRSSSTSRRCSGSTRSPARAMRPACFTGRHRLTSRRSSRADPAPRARPSCGGSCGRGSRDAERPRATVSQAAPRRRTAAAADQSARKRPARRLPLARAAHHRGARQLPLPRRRATPGSRTAAANARRTLGATSSGATPTATSSRIRG